MKRRELLRHLQHTAARCSAKAAIIPGGEIWTRTVAPRSRDTLRSTIIWRARSAKTLMSPSPDESQSVPALVMLRCKTCSVGHRRESQAKFSETAPGLGQQAGHHLPAMAAVDFE